MPNRVSPAQMLRDALRKGLLRHDKACLSRSNLKETWQARAAFPEHIVPTDSELEEVRN